MFNKPSNIPYQRGFFQMSILMGKERTKHPTQKPVALMKKIIEIHSRQGDLIFDPFMGTGSTGIASNYGSRQPSRAGALKWLII